MARTSRKHKKRNRILLLLALLLLAYAVLWFITPSVDQYYGDGGQDGVIASMEIPLLEDDTGYALAYEEEHEQPKWVAYHLTRDEVYGVHERQDNFRADPSISTGSAELDDYRGSGYDRGHLIPAADQTWTEEAMSDSFYMSNMSPQEPAFNRGIWADLEAAGRTMAVTEGSVYVVTGPVLTDGPYKQIGEQGVSVPKYYYKAILDYQEPEYKAIGFLLPNKGSDEDLESFATSIDELEKRTSIDLFPQLPDDQENILESEFAVSDWNLEEFRASQEEREAYAHDNTSVVIPQKDDTTVTKVKQIIDRLMVQTKREARSFSRSLDIPILEALPF
jgi:endonuclease G